ncbi:MAG: T9SS type A sorting domain-containing protein [Bacteroidales bacterium]|nr:T9SS type A sorting domain-containing protein [Bacteroidales bacterium]
MKRLLLIIISITITSALMSQAWLNKLPANKSNYSYYDYKTAFNDYWAPFNVDNSGYYIVNGVQKKADGWKQFNRWAYNMESQINPSTGEFPTKSAIQVYKEYSQVNGIQALSGTKGTWTSLGTNSSNGGYSGIGRVNCIAFHPTDNNTYWVGAPAGGLWKTINNGASWTCLTDDNNVLGVSSIIIPSNYATSNTIYIGTGDRDGWDNRSIGVLKSTDGGATWNTTGLSFTLANSDMVYKMILDPSNNNTILAATSNGVYKTTNGGTSWSTQLTGTSFIDLEYKPGSFSTLYGATKYGKIYVSTNSGVNWTQKLNTGYRVELAVSPANSAYVYAIISSSNNGLHGIYKSTNSGSSFSSVYSSPNLMGWKSNGSDAGGQGYYDLALAVSPTNINKVIMGGVNAHRSTNGGSAWSCANCWTSYNGYNFGNHPEVHADKHNLVYRSNGDLFECNDGGVYLSTDDGATWTDKSDGLVISQMYKLGTSKTVANETITGLQDNGTKLLSGGVWSDVKGGDGMECLIDYTDANTQYGTYVYGQISRTTNHWSSSTAIEPSSAGNGAWVTPYIIDPTTHTTLYAGYSNVWKSTNKGTSWTQISTMSTTNKIRSMAIAPSNTSVLYVADQIHIWKTTNGGTGWANVTSTLPVTSSNITSITVKSNSPTTVWVTLSGYNSNMVYKTTNGGTSWSNISAGLPSIPIYSIVQDITNSGSEALYVGTELGVYYKDGTNNWAEYNTGFPKVSIGELEIYYNTNASNNRLRAATYGRGLWEVELYTSASNAPVANFGATGDMICTGDTLQFTDSSTYTPTSWVWSFTPSTVTYVNSTSSTSQNPQVKFNSSGVYTVSLTATNTSGSDTKTDTNLINVGGFQMPFTEGFETTSTTLGKWGVNNPDGATTWSLATTAGNPSGTRSVYMNFYNYASAIGQVDYLFTPLLNLSSLSSASLKFRHAYTRYDATGTDSLYVYITGDCGATWTKIVSMGENGSGSFATAPNSTYVQSASFSPSISSDWCGAGVGPSCDSIDISSYAGNDNVRIAFTSYNNYGNNLYIDDVLVDGSTSSAISASFTTPSSSVCAATQTVFTNTSQNATTYTWKENGAIVSTSQNLTKTFAAAGSYIIKLIASDGTNLDSTSQTITVNSTPLQAATPTGATNICINSSPTSTYTTTPVTGATSYAWTVSPTTAGTISGSGTSTTLTWTATYSGSVDIKVQAINACGNGSFSSPLTVNVSSAPAAAIVPTGPITLCVNPTNSVYNCTAIANATSYQWMLSPSTAGTLTSTSTTATIDWDNAFVGNATLTVIGVNTCGNGVPSPALNISVNDVPATPSTPSGPTSLCKDNANTNYSVASVSYATTYLWDIAPSTVGTVSSNGTSATVDWDNQYVGTASLKVSAGNNCGTGPFSSVLNITINPSPTTPTITSHLDTLFSSSPTANQWYYSSSLLSGATNPYYIVSTNGNYFVEVTNSNGCKAKSAAFYYNSVGITTVLNNNEVSIFPNPAKDYIIIKYSGSQEVVFVLRNVLGETLLSDEFTKEKRIDLSAISSGVYFITMHVKDKPNAMISRKIIIR